MRWFWPLWLLAAGITAALTLAARATPRFPADIAVARFVQAIDLFGVPQAVHALSEVGGGAIAVVLVAMVAGGFALARRRDLLVVFLVASACRPLSGLIKWLTERPRPSAALVHVTERPTDPSFPSGHVLSAMLFYGVLAVLLEATNLPRTARRLIQATCVAVILLMGPSRVYTGAHWPSDVLGGYLWGILVLSAIFRLSHSAGMFSPGTRPPGAAQDEPPRIGTR